MRSTPAAPEMTTGPPGGGSWRGHGLAAGLTSMRRFLDGRVPWLWLVLLVGAGTTIGIWQFASFKIEQTGQARFAAVQDQTVHLIRSRLDRHVQILQGALAMVTAPSDSSSELWSAYVEALDIETHHPSLKGIGYLEWRPPSSGGGTSITQFTQLGGPDLGAALEELAQDPHYRNAMDRARDSGKPAIAWPLPSRAGAGPLDLVWFLPRYADLVPPNTVEARREQLLGLVFGLARLDDLHAPIVPPRDQVGVEIRTGTPADGDDLVLYRSPELTPGRAERSRFAEQVVLHMHGQPWTMRFFSLPAFDADVDRLSGPSILAGGTVITLLLAALIRSLGRSRWAEAHAHVMQLELEARAKDLDHVNAELEQFVYIASHDLKAPLRGIDHLAGWIEEDLGEALQGEVREHLTMLRGRVHRLETFLDDLLRYSRASRHTPPIERVDVDLLIRETFAMLNAEERFELVTSGDSLQFDTAKSALGQVLTNLFSNAIKHHDRATGRIEVVVHDRGPFCEFVVADDGPGIVPEHQQRIFQMFQTLQPRDRVEGSGMGLALVRKLVEQHAGTIGVESDGRGAAFRFTWKKS